MSVLNQASDGLYTVLIALARAIVRFGPRSREDLFLACGSTVASVDPLHAVPRKSKIQHPSLEAVPTCVVLSDSLLGGVGDLLFLKHGQLFDISIERINVLREHPSNCARQIC